MEAPEATLANADTELQDLHEQIAEIGEEDVEAVAQAYDEFTTVLDRYEDRATDRDDFQGYIEFREKLSAELGSLPSDLPHRDAFEAADEELTTGVTSVLKERNFDRARDYLEPARELVELKNRRAEVEARYRNARNELQKRQSKLESEITELERLLKLGDADLDAPVELIKEPIEAYNDAVAEAFARFKQEAPARAVLDLLAETSAYPLVDYRTPPENLVNFLEKSSVGEKPISKVLDFAGYSSSKLDHYVDDPQAFRANVATNQTYLASLDATPLQVTWPPGSAEGLQWQLRERIAVVGRFADDEVVALARDVKELGQRDDFEELRTSASAQAELSEHERTRLRDGTIERDLAETGDELEAVSEALAAHPPLSRRF